MDTERQNIKIVLYAEDDPEDMKMTLAAMAECHLAAQIIAVRDGAEALDYLYRRKKFETRAGGEPVLVLLDNKMPKVSGLEALKIIKADEHLKTIPVVAFTSSRLPSDLAEFYKYGVNGYVVKPVGFSEFMTAVKQLSAYWMTANEPPPLEERKRP